VKERQASYPFSRSAPVLRGSNLSVGEIRSVAVFLGRNVAAAEDGSTPAKQLPCFQAAGRTLSK